MSNDVNMTVLIGRLGKDPEVKYLPNGTPVANVTVATGRQWRTDDGQDHEETTWHDVVFWNKMAETVSKYLHKGSSVYVQGRISNRTWDKPDGTKGYRTEIVAERMKMLDPAPAQGNGQRRAQRPPAQAAAVIDEDEIPW